MKSRFLVFCIVVGCLLLAVETPAQEAAWPQAKPEDVTSPSVVVKASYDAISVPAGHELNMDRFRSLFLPNAQLVSVSTKGGQGDAHIMTLKDFTDKVAPGVGKEGHVEREIAERVEVYGNIAHVWSTYESRKTPDDPHVTRGINSIQLVNDGKRWWISGAQWEHETPESPIPAKYLKGRR